MAVSPLRVLHVTTGLESGGAEMCLFQLVSRMDRTRFECSVASLTDAGPILGERIRAEGVPVAALRFRRGSPNPLLVLRLARHIRRIRPDVIQTWMYHADLVGALAGRLAGARGVIWGVHNSDLAARHTRVLTRKVIAANRRLSHSLPTRIVCCSEAARHAHADMGFRADIMHVIPNGIDTAAFTPDRAARASVRRELGLPDRTPLVGLVARFDPHKDHETFFRAAGLLHARRPDVHFVLCGSQITGENAMLARWGEAAGVAAVTHLLGLRRDIGRITAALDVATCCSSSESFALVLGEAMACGVPCVTTDLAGPRSVVGEHGRVVPVQDPQALAGAWQEMLALSEQERQDWGRGARKHILRHYSLEKTVRAYEELYTNTMNSATPQRG